jgi:hypothetical protein
MGYAIKNAATVAVTLALGSVLVACGGGGASQTETHQEPPGGTLNTPSGVMLLSGTPRLTR